MLAQTQHTYVSHECFLIKKINHMNILATPDTKSEQWPLNSFLFTDQDVIFLPLENEEDVKWYNENTDRECTEEKIWFNKNIKQLVRE